MTLTERLRHRRNQINELEGSLREASTAAGELFRTPRDGLTASQKLDLESEIAASFRRKGEVEQALRMGKAALKQLENEQAGLVLGMLKKRYVDQVAALGPTLRAFGVLALRRNQIDSGLAGGASLFLPELGDRPASQWASSNANMLPFHDLGKFDADAQRLLDRLLLDLEAGDAHSLTQAVIEKEAA